MSDAYENALRTVAAAYDAERHEHGGKSLSRVATIVVSSGSFFERLFDGRGFSVQNLEKFAAWFRAPANWPMGEIPHEAAVALTSIGRPPFAVAVPLAYRTDAAQVACDQQALSQRGAA